MKKSSLFASILVATSLAFIGQAHALPPNDVTQLNSLKNKVQHQEFGMAHAFYVGTDEELRATHSGQVHIAVYSLGRTKRVVYIMADISAKKAGRMIHGTYLVGVDRASIGEARTESVAGRHVS